MLTPFQRRHRVSLFSFRIWRRRLAFWGGAVVVGLTASIFALGGTYAQELFRRVLGWSHWLPLILTPLTLGLVAYMTQRYFKGAEGSGIPQTIAAIRMKNPEDQEAVLSIRVTLGKMFLTWLGLMGGASVGREGPTVQVGAALLYSLQRIVRFPPHLMERGLIVAGGGAGVAAAFNTPLAGIVFAIEEMARSFEERSSGILLTAVIVAGLAAVYVLGDYTYFGVSHASLSGAEALVGVLICGVVGGVLGGGFSLLVLVYDARGLPGRMGVYLRTHPVSFAAACGLALAVLGLLSGDTVFGSGYLEAKHLLEGTQVVPQGYGLMKILATLVSFVSGIPGGLFAPSLSAGAGIGHNIAVLLGTTEPGGVVLLGMAAYFAGVVQAPITAFVIVMEMTANNAMVVPLMAVTVLANVISRMVCPRPLYKSLSETYLRQVRSAAG